MDSEAFSADVPGEAPKTPTGIKAVLALLRFAGPRRKLAFVGTFLAALNGVLTVVPLVLVWFVLRDFVAVAPHWELAADAALWAWLAFGAAFLGLAVYFGALMLTHTAAFRVAANMRKRCLAHVARVPLGYFDANASGHLRRVIDGCAGQTEDVIAHKMPDFVASLTAPVAFLVAIFSFDWIMGLVCLVPVIVSFFAMWWMMGREVEGGGRHFMALYQNALNRMSTAATEYVRGIPVVKVFQQTVHSFRAFHEAIVDYRDMATNYVRSCRMPQVAQLTAINGTFAVLVPAAPQGQVAEQLLHALAEAADLDEPGADGVPQAHAHQQNDQDVVGQVGVDAAYDGVEYIVKLGDECFHNKFPPENCSQPRRRFWEK